MNSEPRPGRGKTRRRSPTQYFRYRDQGRRQQGLRTLVLVSLLERQSGPSGVFDGFGHYEGELVKVNGKWLFTKRTIFNEGRDEWAYKGVKNPAW